VNQMMACTCGSLLEEGDVFCGNCGSPRPAAAPPPVPAPPLVDDRIPGPPPLTIPEPVIPQPGITDGQARGSGRGLPRRHQEERAPAPQPRESISPSQFDADSVYLQKTLRHEPMELALDDSVSPGMLGLVLLRAFLAWFGIIIVTVIFAAFMARGGSGGAAAAGILGFIASVIVFWIVLLRAKVSEPIGEWRTLLADRAGQSGSYYRMMVAVLNRRELPIKPKLRSIQLTTPGRPVKHTIVLSEDQYRVYVTVFPYGTSLYVGWQMWRRRSGAQLIKRALVDHLTAANLVTAMLRTDRARALREAVHLACREALYAAPDEGLWVQAQQLRLPNVEQEAALLVPQQAASPALPPATMMPPGSSAP
jgi:hypothetical protein